MMIIGTIAWAIGCEPVWSFQWWSEDTKRGVMGCDNRPSCEGIGGNHAMNQSVRNMRAAVEGDGHKNDSRSTIGDCQTSILTGRYLAAHGLEHGFELLYLKGGNRFDGCSIRIEYFNSTHIKSGCREVGQMQLV